MANSTISRKRKADSSASESKSETVEKTNIQLEDTSDFESSEEDEEDEDDDAQLVTEQIDQGINKVLTALRTNPEEILQSDIKFYPEIGKEDVQQTSSQKPVYLKDYQRERYLEKGADNSDDEEDDVPNIETYNDEQNRLKTDLINQFHDNDDEDEDDFLQKREGAERDIPDVELPDPEKDAEGFLTQYLNNKAWIQKDKTVPTYKEIVEEEENEEFEDRNDQYETAYNFRYEDPNGAEIVSYARDQTTVRRDKMSNRQKKREKERLAREKEEEQEKLQLAKQRKSKVNEVADKLGKLQDALGEGDEKIAQILAEQDLDGDWDDNEWDRRMQKLFDDEFYDRQDKDAKDAAEALNMNTTSGADDNNDVEYEDLGESVEPEETHVDVPRKLTKKEARQKAEQFVKDNEDLLLDSTKLAQQKKNSGFRYRDVDPESFGLTSRDILLASDKDLNNFAGLKKLASYREKEIMEKDRRRYGKSKRLRQWRREVFGNEESPDDSLWEAAKVEFQKELEQNEAKTPKDKSKNGGKNNNKNKNKNKNKSKNKNKDKSKSKSESDSVLDSNSNSLAAEDDSGSSHKPKKQKVSN